MRKAILIVAALALAAGSPAAVAGPGEGESGTIRELREELRRLRDRVEELEGRLGEAAVPADDGTDVLGEAVDRVAGPNVGAPLVRGLRLSGQLRFQAEDRMDFDFDDRAGDTEELVRQRIRVALDADVSDLLRAYVKIQDSRVWGEEHAVGGNLRGVDLKEGFADFREVFCATTLRVGRQELSYGDQRLISPLDWDHVGRSWDGVRLMIEPEDFSLHLFVTRVDERGLGSGQDENEDFLGAYATFGAGEGANADLYALYRRNRDADEIVGEDGKGGHENLFTLGGRMKVVTGPLDLVAEITGQIGDHANDDVRAWAAEAEAGYTFADAAWTPRIGAGWTLASGDDDPTDGDAGTFDPLYTFGHFYLGYADRVGRRNVNSPRIFLDLAPAAGLNLSLDWHFFWLWTEKDGLYGAAGKLLRATAPGAGRFVGHEVDLHAKWKLDPNLTLWGGWAHFFAGQFLDDTGASDDADFLYLQVTVDF